MRIFHCSFPILRPLVAAGGCLVLGGSVGAQAPEVSLTLQDVRTAVDRLAPGAASGEAIFLVDQGSMIEIDVVSTIGAVTTRIVTPTGTVIDAASIGGLGGELTLFEGRAGQDSSLITAVGEPGFHSLYRFPALGPGPYRVQFDAGAGLAQEVAVITQLRTDSPVTVALVATEPQVAVGDTAVLTAAVFEGDRPVAGATVEVTLRAPDGTYSTVAVDDDGQDPDTAAGDGLYSGELDPTQAGKHGAVARVSGATTSGLPFERQAVTQFLVTAASSRLTGAFTDAGVDDDADGLFNRLRIEAGTDTQLDSQYRLFVTLATTSGQTLVRSGDAALAAGPGTVPVDFEADAIVGLRENGPYRISSLELVRLTPAGAVPAHRLVDVGSTRDYRLSEFQRPALALTGGVTDQAFDDDGNGRFDRLQVGVEVDVLRAGSYTWSFKLTDRERRDIGFGSASGLLNAGINSISLTFPGRPIGAARADGPYLLRDLLMFGAGASLVAPELGQTRPYLGRQFEGFPNQPPVADAGHAQTLECSSHSGTLVTLNGSGSSDPDGDPLGFEWKDENNNVVGTTAIASVTVPLGMHLFTLKVTDPAGLSSTATTQITVRDTTPPVIASLTADPSELRPRNKLVPVRLTVSVRDTCDANPSCKIISVVRKEDDDDKEDDDRARGHEARGSDRDDDHRDWVITGDLTLELRAKRGRVYVITVRCTDSSGNRSTKAVTVKVRRGKED